MSYFLLKTEPSDYTIDNLQEDKKTTWDGVKNALAIKYIKTIKKKDRCFIYHTGKEKQIVGLGEATSNFYINESDEVVFDIKYVKTFSLAYSLAAMKKDSRFNGIDLVRLPRLSVMPISIEIANIIIDYCNTKQ